MDTRLGVPEATLPIAMAFAVFLLSVLFNSSTAEGLPLSFHSDTSFVSKIFEQCFAVS